MPSASVCCFGLVYHGKHLSFQFRSRQRRCDLYA
nr:MAG TPA: hypothetical protein [Caudoviricetes sp.]